MALAGCKTYMTIAGYKRYMTLTTLSTKFSLVHRISVSDFSNICACSHTWRNLNAVMHSQYICAYIPPEHTIFLLWIDIASIGFHCEEHENPADFFLDVISSCESRTTFVNQGQSSLPPLPTRIHWRSVFDLVVHLNIPYLQFCQVLFSHCTQDCALPS